MQARHWPVPFFMDEALPLVDYFRPNQKIWRVYSLALSKFIRSLYYYTIYQISSWKAFLSYLILKIWLIFVKRWKPMWIRVWVMGWATRRLAEGHKFNFVGRTCIFCFLLPMLLTEKTSYSTKNTININYHDDQKGDAPFLLSDFNSLTIGKKYLFQTFTCSYWITF